MSLFFVAQSFVGADGSSTTTMRVMAMTGKTTLRHLRSSMVARPAYPAAQLCKGVGTQHLFEARGQRLDERCPVGPARFASMGC